MAALSTPDGYLIGIDFGEARVGLAIASSVAKLPTPYKILPNDENLLASIADILKDEGIGTVVVGLPRDQSGKETAQTIKVRDFAQNLNEELGIEVAFADESLSSVRAEEMRKDLKDRPAGSHIDDLAACFILEEFLKGR